MTHDCREDWTRPRRRPVVRHRSSPSSSLSSRVTVCGRPPPPANTQSSSRPSDRPHVLPAFGQVQRPTLIAASLFLGRVALAAQQPIAIKLSRGRFVGLCVGQSVGASVCPVHYGKTADRIRMPFGVIGRTGPGMRQVGIVPREGVLMGANFGRAIVTSGDFTAYVCDSAATRPCSQITLGRLVHAPYTPYIGDVVCF